MELECIFTRELAKESYMQADEDEVLEALKQSVTHFLDVCSTASLVGFKDSGFRQTGEVTPQPFVRAVVSCETGPQEDLLKRQVSIVGDAELFSDDVFPVKLLGPTYWVTDEVERSLDSIERDRDSESEETSQSRVDGIVDKVFTLFN